MLVGIDIGGTTSRVAAVSDGGTVLVKRTVPTQPELGPAHAVATLEHLIGEVAAEADAEISAIGVGVTGPVDRLTGIVDNPYTLGGWGRIDLASALRQRFLVPVTVDNDANAAALGEWWQGAGRAARRFAAITIGTGIGAGLLIDGQVQRASDGRHGEAGHQILDPHGPECYCGARGCWEVLAAGPALTRMGQEAPLDSLIHQLSHGRLDAIDGPLVALAARRGDSAATEIVRETGQWIGLGLVNLAAIFCPDVVVLGGSVSHNFELLRPTVDDTLAAHAAMVPIDFRLLAATTGDDAGVLGAAKAAHDALATAAVRR